MSFAIQQNRPFAYYSEVTTWNPRFDVRENGDGYELDGELPGVNQEDINMEFTDPQTLVVNGGIKREYEVPESSTAGQRYWASERSVGSFQRVFTFPQDINQNDVKATLRKGLLKVKIPKTAPPATTNFPCMDPAGDK
ncbi:hypothetical protein KEM56_003390 [Ascosphaera pollenicola]|nr:hypothetical protein KEM56_003390 [Ascosphaera pollenicola]